MVRESGSTEEGQTEEETWGGESRRGAAAAAGDLAAPVCLFKRALSIERGAVPCCTCACCRHSSGRITPWSLGDRHSRMQRMA